MKAALEKMAAELRELSKERDRKVQTKCANITLAAKGLMQLYKKVK